MEKDILLIGQALVHQWEMETLAGFVDRVNRILEGENLCLEILHFASGEYLCVFKSIIS